VIQKTTVSGLISNAPFAIAEPTEKSFTEMPIDLFVMLVMKPIIGSVLIVDALSLMVSTPAF
jgi:hypothetical protein